MTVEAPPLAKFLPITQYIPSIGDFVIWAGWFRTWYGVIAGVSSDSRSLQVIWEGLPYLLFTLTDAEQKAALGTLDLAVIHGSKPGNISVMKHDTQHNSSVWYV